LSCVKNSETDTPIKAKESRQLARSRPVITFEAHGTLFYDYLPPAEADHFDTIIWARHHRQHVARLGGQISCFSSRRWPPAYMAGNSNSISGASSRVT
jgi:hypothetical protein